MNKLIPKATVLWRMLTVIKLTFLNIPKVMEPCLFISLTFSKILGTQQILIDW